MPYDANGNRTSWTNAGGTVLEATYDDQDRLLSYRTATDTVAFEYSAAGELERKVQARI